jgi:hypothetical protein
MGKQRFKVGLVQMAMSTRPEENVEKAAAKVREAAKLGAEVVCLPEMYRTPYFCQKEDHAQLRAGGDGARGRAPRPSAAPRGRRGGGRRPVFERRAPGVYHNSAVVLDADGTVAGLYRKMHIPDDPLFYEKFYFAPGDLGFRGLRREAGPHRDPHLLGPVVPRGRAAHRAARRRRPLLPDRDRLAPEREGGARRLASARPGRRSSARTRSRTGSTSRR